MNYKYALTHFKDTVIYFLSYCRFLSDESFIKIKYKLVFGKYPNLKNPETFNEKQQWLKLYYRKPELTMLVDKYKVREYIQEVLGSQYLIPLINCWDCVNDIDIDSLPNQFVLKCSHDSKSVVICKDKSSFDFSAAKKKLKKKFKSNLYWWGREWPYKDVPPKIIAEKYMEDSTGCGDLTDYKLHFFNGECKAIMVGKNRFGDNGFENDFYTPQWEHFDFRRGNTPNAKKANLMPKQLPEMIALGSKLAKDYPFVRTDFYVINDKIYFGEITFFPGSGFIPFVPDKWDKVFGEWIHLDINK